MLSHTRIGGVALCGVRGQDLCGNVLQVLAQVRHEPHGLLQPHLDRINKNDALQSAFGTGGEGH